MEDASLALPSQKNGTCVGKWNAYYDRSMIKTCPSFSVTGRTCHEPPNPHNGFWRTHDDVADLHCSPGYSPTGLELIRCNGGKWDGIFNVSCEGEMSVDFLLHDCVNPKLSAMFVSRLVHIRDDFCPFLSVRSKGEGNGMERKGKGTEKGKVKDTESEALAEMEKKIAKHPSRDSNLAPSANAERLGNERFFCTVFFYFFKTLRAIRRTLFHVLLQVTCAKIVRCIKVLHDWMGGSLSLKNNCSTLSSPVESDTS